MTTPSILIAGIGNIFLGDDAFGCEVLRRLLERSWPDNVRVEDFGIRGLDLAYALLDGFDLVILVDATPRGGAPGTIYTIEPELNVDLKNVTALVDAHGMNPMKVLAMVQSLGGELKRVVLVGCEPETLGPEEGHMGLSTAVESSLDTAVNVVNKLVESFLTEKNLLNEQRGIAR